MDADLETELLRIGVASSDDSDYDAAERRIAESATAETCPEMPPSMGAVYIRLQGKYLALIKMESDGRGKTKEYGQLVSLTHADIRLYGRMVVEEEEKQRRKKAATGTIVSDQIRKELLGLGGKTGEVPPPGSPKL